MSEEISQYEIGGHKVNILDQVVDYSFGELFKIIRATLQFERYDGQMSKPMTRINFERADSVGILLYDPDRDDVVLTEQFRYPVYASLDPDKATGVGAKKAWLLEIVAGVQDAGKTVIEVAQKELFEEAGYRIETDGSWHLIAKGRLRDGRKWRDPGCQNHHRTPVSCHPKIKGSKSIG
jgi:8-oxo-dGTP pyrophosphatase MutT (NUDIX family)